MTHPLAKSTGITGILCALALGPAAAQTLDASSHVAHGVQPPTPTASPLPGADPTDECALYLARSERGLVLTFAGQRVFDVVTGAAGDQACNARAEDLLRDAFGGSHERLANALPAHRREAGTHDFARFLAVLTDRHGAVRSVRALGTMAEGRHDAATYVRVRFVDGEELLRVKWRGDRLALVTRGVLPHVRTHPLQDRAVPDWGGPVVSSGAVSPDAGACLLLLETAGTAPSTTGYGERE